MTDFGTSWSCLTDLTMPSIMVTGHLAVAQAIARRWQTPRGKLLGDANYGYDLSDFVGDDLDKAAIAAMSHFAADEAEKDERVLSCNVSITLFGGTLQVLGNVITSDGPFNLVVSVSEFETKLLQVQ